jgi:hypothetical protein
MIQMKNINIHAPVVCNKSITISADSKKVWSVLTGITNWPAWNTEISHVKLKGDLRPGTRFDWKSGGVKINSTLHTVEPFKNFGWTGKAMGSFAIHNWTVTEMNGQTKVVVEESMEGFLVKVLRGTFQKNVESGMQKWLELMKQACESA